jgi:hypothetical protein
MKKKGRPILVGVDDSCCPPLISEAEAYAHLLINRNVLI